MRVWKQINKDTAPEGLRIMTTWTTGRDNSGTFQTATFGSHRIKIHSSGTEHVSWYGKAPRGRFTNSVRHSGITLDELKSAIEHKWGE